MKRLFFTLFLSATISSAAFAQRFQVGLRAGVNISDLKLPSVNTDNGLLRSSGSKAGFEGALAARLSFTKHLNLQAEFEYDRVNYGFRFGQSSGPSDITIHANRIEIPVMLGLNFGPVRLFGGASFRVTHSEKSSAPSLLKVKFDDSKVALTGGVGFNIRKFFIEGRVTGYPKRTTEILTVKDTDHRLTSQRDLKWSVSGGFMF